MSDMFEDQRTPGTTTEVTLDQSNFPNYEDLVGEGKRYKDNAALAKAIAEKDRFIERLKSESQEARDAVLRQEEELNTFRNQTELLTRIEAKLRQLPDSDRDTPDTRNELNDTPNLTRDDVLSLLQTREQEKTKEQNARQVEATLSQEFGADWRDRVRTFAKELNVSTQYLTAIAQDSPTAFYRLIGVTPNKDARPPVSPAPPRSTVSSPPAQTGARTYEFYQQQRKEKGDTWYFSSSVQRQLWNDLSTLGEKEFYAS